MANEFVTRRGLISLGGVTFPYVGKTSTYSISDDDYFVNCSGTFTVTLPTAVSVAGKIYVIKNSGSGTVTIDTTSSQTIDGSLSKSLTQNQSVSVESDGSNWLIFVDTSISGTQSGSVDIITSSFSGINITTGTTNSTIDTIYNSSLDPSLAMPSTVGGILATTTVADLSSKTFVQLFDDLLFPTVSPTYTIPTISAVSTVTGIREIGLTISPSITLTGTENDAGPYSKLVINKNTNGGGNVALLTVTSTASMTVNTTTAIAAQFGYTDPNNPNLTYAISTSETIAVPAPASGGSSTIVYSGTGDYDAGLAKKNNKGVTHSASAAVRTTTAPQAASTNFGSNTQTITGYYPYFFGKTSTQQTAADIVNIIQSGTGYTKVVNAGSGSLSMAFNATGEWPWFAIYSVYPTKTAWYETALNSGPIGSPTDLFPTPTTLSVVSPDGYWTVTYRIYPANKVTTIGTATIS